MRNLDALLTSLVNIDRHNLVAILPCKALGEKTIVGLLVSAEIAHQKAHLPQSAEAEAERQKMERLRKLRLEKEVRREISRFVKRRDADGIRGACTRTAEQAHDCDQA